MTSEKCLSGMWELVKYVSSYHWSYLESYVFVVKYVMVYVDL